MLLRWEQNAIQETTSLPETNHSDLETVAQARAVGTVSRYTLPVLLLQRPANCQGRVQSFGFREAGTFALAVRFPASFGEPVTPTL